MQGQSSFEFSMFNLIQDWQIYPALHSEFQCRNTVQAKSNSATLP